MKSAFRLIVRKTYSHIPQLIGLVLLLTVGVCFFITLYTITMRYEETAEQYFTDQAYADVTFYGTFDDDNIKTLSEQHGIVSAQGRMVRDYRDEERIIRTISLTDNINIPYVYEGRLPEKDTECIVLKRNAKAMTLSIGDTITLGGKETVITGLAASPEYLYMVQNERTTMAQTDRFGVVYVTQEFFSSDSDGYEEEGHERYAYNEIIALSEDNIPVDKYSDKIGAFRSVVQKDQPNHYMYRSDLDQIGSFAYIFPLVFAVLIAVVIYVMLVRTIQKDRRQIGTMKALGVSDRKIIGIYLSQFCFAALVGALIGCFTAMLVSDAIIDIFSSMFEVPTLSYVIYPDLWLTGVIISVLLCTCSGLIALFAILPLLPAQAMRPRIPKGGKRILLERIGFLWKQASFNTRYALKNSLRNKGRFFAVVLGMCGSCALLAFSLGFNDSIRNTQNKYFDDFADYDVIVSFDPMLLVSEHPAAAWTKESRKALTLPVTIRDENYTLIVVENNFDMVNIPRDALQNGVIIPEYFAQQWSVEVGQTLEIRGFKVVVSAIIPQYLAPALYSSFDYIDTITNELPAAYNTLYGRSGDVATLSSYLKDSNIEFSTIDDDKTSFNSIMESMSVLIWFMIACSVILGFTVLYSVGLINLSAREHEYMFMGVMGYPHKSILMAHIKETLVQLALAIPLGFIAGNLLLESIKGEFSSNSFVIATEVYPQSYIASALSVIAVTALMAIVTSKHIRGLDIVEGLKAQDD